MKSITSTTKKHRNLFRHLLTMEHYQIQSLAEQSRLVLTEQSVNQEEEKLQTVSKRDMTLELATYDRMETVLLNNIRIDRKTDVACTLMARDYKGYGNKQNGNGVIEWK